MAKRGSKNGAAQPAEAMALSVPTKWGGVPIGDDTVSVGANVDRDNLNLEAADLFVCGRRLNVRLVQHASGDDPNQKYIAGAEAGSEVRGVADCKKFGTTPKEITTRFTFALEEVDLDSLAHFAKRPGTIQVLGVEDLTAGNAGDQEDEEEADE